jgi:hypothetical protein
MDALGSQPVLDGLRGIHRPILSERLAAAFQAFWRALAVGSIGLGVAVVMVVGLTRETWTDVVESAPYAWAFNAVFVLSAIAALGAATRIYVVTDHKFGARFGLLPVWSVHRSTIVDASVVQGMFQRTLVLSLRDGAEKRVALLKSMRRVLDAEHDSEIAGPPNDELQRTRPAQAMEPRR